MAVFHGSLKVVLHDLRTELVVKFSMSYVSSLAWNFLPLQNLLSHWEIFPTWIGNPYHRKFFPTMKSFRREIFHTGNSFPPLTRKSSPPVIPSHQEILPTGNSFPPGIPSHQEIFYIGNSFPPGTPSHR